MVSISDYMIIYIEKKPYIHIYIYIHTLVYIYTK